MEQSRKLAFAFTGAGKLVTFQLGAATILRTYCIRQQQQPFVVAGSGSGAIAATLLAFAPNSIESFAKLYMEKHHADPVQLLLNTVPLAPNTKSFSELHIALTNCVTREPHVFEFNNNPDNELLAECLEASIALPPGRNLDFHELLGASADLIRVTNDDGCELVDGEYYCDGTLSAPGPPVPAGYERILVSPFVFVNNENNKNNLICSPNDGFLSSRVALAQRVLVSGDVMKYSFRNATALEYAGKGKPEDMRNYYQQGIEAAQAWLHARDDKNEATKQSS
jgi:hypothetical protein